jgi:hypothetical protein
MPQFRLVRAALPPPGRPALRGRPVCFCVWRVASVREDPPARGLQEDPPARGRRLEVSAWPEVPVAQRPTMWRRRPDHAGLWQFPTPAETSTSRSTSPSPIVPRGVKNLEQPPPHRSDWSGSRRGRWAGLLGLQARLAVVAARSPPGGARSRLRITGCPSGRMVARAKDGTEVDMGAGVAFVAAAGHDAYIVGDGRPTPLILRNRRISSRPRRAVARALVRRALSRSHPWTYRWR